MSSRAYKMQSKFFPEPVVVVSDQEAYKRALKEWDCLNKGIAMFSERELLWLGSTMDMDDEENRSMIEAIYETKVRFHGALEVPKDFDHNAYAVESMGDEGERAKRDSERREKEAVGKRMDKLRRAANG